MTDLRHLIREILTEELGQALVTTPTASRVTEERVQIRSNAELDAFVRRLLAAAKDGRLRADIEAGRHVFRLAETGAPLPLQAHQSMAPAPHSLPPVRFERGLVTERDVSCIPRGAQHLEVGKTVRFTPLASDELRRRGIRIERIPS